MESTVFSIWGIFKKSSRLSAVTMVSIVISSGASVYIARVLGPENLGVLAVLGVWTFYLGLVRPGLISTAGRDMPHLIGAGKLDEARRLQNIAITGELVFSFVPLMVMVIVGFLYDETVLRYGMWLTAAGFAVTGAQSLFASMLYVYQRFDAIARLRAILNIGSQLTIVALVAWLGVYTSLIVSVIAGLLALGFVMRYRAVIAYRPEWDWMIAREMMKVGLPMVVLTLLSWAYFMSDRPALMVAGASMAMLGYYAFASNTIKQVASILWDFTSVLQPVLYREIGRHGSIQNVSIRLAKIWIPYTAAGCIIATLGQVGFGLVVTWFAPRLIPSIPVFEVLVFILVFYNATQLPNLVLCSTLVNRQNFNAVLWGIGLALNVVGLYLIAIAGYDLLVIAAASMLIDLIIAIAGYISIHGYLFHTSHQAIVFYGWMAALMLSSAALYSIFQMGPLAYSSANNTFVAFLLRACSAAALWGLVGAAMVQWLRSVQSSPALQDSGVEPSV